MKRIAVLDLETDPFAFNVVPQPFVVGFYDGKQFVTIWSGDCIVKAVAFLLAYPEPLLIYAHNGGKFDWMYFLEHLPQGSLRIVNGRIIEARLGKHTLRDSYSIMPFPLRDFNKDDIDYDKMHRDVREQHKDEICSYLRTDCVSLYELIVAFHEEFGNKLTIGSSALAQLKKFHTYEKGTRRFDETFRNDFYFGGRNQCFRTGIIKRPCRIYDVNSMYPDSMKSYLHPVGTFSDMGNRIGENTCFVVATGHNYGAFPTRTKEGSLDFTVPYGKFHTTIHEWNAAEETGTFKPVKIHRTYNFYDRITFAEFIDHFYDARKHAKSVGDKIHELFYKFVLNSAYGKFAQNPDNFFDWKITAFDTVLRDPCPICEGTGICPKHPTPVSGKKVYCRCKGLSRCWFCQGNKFQWSPAAFHDKYTIWQCPSSQSMFNNVTTGASITGAARAVLLRGIAAAVNPMYCDTDSIICEDLPGVRQSDTELGAWKLEGEGTVAAICGKKLYAIFAPDGKCTDCKQKNHDPKVHPKEPMTIKKAHKGVRLTGKQILRVAAGETIEAENPVPCFKLNGKHQFTRRKIRRTG